MSKLKENLMAGVNSSDVEMPHPAKAKILTEPDAFTKKYGYSWDFCAVFPIGRDTTNAMLKKFHDCGIETYLYHSVQRDEIYCKLRVAVEPLARHADDVDFKILLDETRLMVAMEAGFEEPKIAGRNVTHDPLITPYRPYQNIYGKYDTAERLATMYATREGLSHPFSSVVRLKLFKEIITQNKQHCCDINIVHELEEGGSLLAFFPLHDFKMRDALTDKWLHKWSWPNNQPFDDIKDYFGEKIALYFVFLGHYTTWLIPLSIVGIIVQVDMLAEWSVDATLVPYMCIFVAFWAVLLLEYWKRTESTWAMKWGTSNYEDEEHDRPQFHGTKMISFIDGSEITYYPPDERGRKQLIGNVIIGSMIFLVLGCVAGIFLLKYWLAYDSGSSLLESTGSTIGSIINSMQILLLNYVYKEIAVHLTDMENHRSDTEYEDNLIAKLFLFQFVNSYASCAYIAFIEPYVDNASCEGSCMLVLMESLGIIFCTRLLTANAVEIYLPRYIAKKKEKEEREGVPEGTFFSRPEIEYAMGTYDEMMGPLEDMSELSIQFGYVTLFVTAFPLAPFLALVSNYMEIRIDAWKIAYEHRRPMPRGAQDIGTWQAIWSITAVISVASNAGIVFFTSNVYEDLSAAGAAWAFILSQYAVFGFMFFFAYLVDDVPPEVQIQLRRQNFLVSKIIDQVADEEEEFFEPMSPSRAHYNVVDGDNEAAPTQERKHFTLKALL